MKAVNRLVEVVNMKKWRSYIEQVIIPNVSLGFDFQWQMDNLASMGGTITYQGEAIVEDGKRVNIKLKFTTTDVRLSDPKNHIWMNYLVNGLNFPFELTGNESTDLANLEKKTMEQYKRQGLDY